MLEPKNSLSQLFTMSAIVATALIVPLGALVALACLIVGVSPHAVLTFGGTLHAAGGVAAWWAIALVPAAVYAAIVTHS